MYLDSIRNLLEVPNTLYIFTIYGLPNSYSSIFLAQYFFHIFIHIFLCNKCIIYFIT